jgi:hypothetical protein
MAQDKVILPWRDVCIDPARSMVEPISREAIQCANANQERNDDEFHASPSNSRFHEARVRNPLMTPTVLPNLADVQRVGEHDARIP